MVAGLIDADLGGNVVKRGALCLGVERAVVPVRCSLRTKAVDGFSSMDLRRMSGRTSARQSLKRSRRWPMII
ncbi:hypothetical protein [Paraburkholderia sp. A3BS-1L]|uniref:hypothetical protein n=1 Tax=unclassified Paraburkholderia TaxID=2615204 RepID=UPI003DAA45F4